jgi:hypothetical protein
MRPRPKRLIVNADDLGYDPQIDRGVFEASTATSTTTRGPSCWPPSPRLDRPAVGSAK